MPDEFSSFTAFMNAVRGYGWSKISIELILIGLVVYWVVRFLRGTRGARMLKGVSFLLIILYLVVRLVGTKFGFQRIEFLYGKFLYFASFAVVVVFQPELRRALMRIGESTKRPSRHLPRILSGSVSILRSSPPISIAGMTLSIMSSDATPG